MSGSGSMDNLNEPETNTYRLGRRTPQGQIDYLVNQVSFLVARVGTLERELAELRVEVNRRGES